MYKPVFGGAFYAKWGFEIEGEAHGPLRSEGNGSRACRSCGLYARLRRGGLVRPDAGRGADPLASGDVCRSLRGRRDPCGEGKRGEVSRLRLLRRDPDGTIADDDRPALRERVRLRRENDPVLPSLRRRRRCGRASLRAPETAVIVRFDERAILIPNRIRSGIRQSLPIVDVYNATS